MVAVRACHTFVHAFQSSKRRDAVNIRLEDRGRPLKQRIGFVIVVFY